MIAQAKGRYFRVSPSKLRMILDLIRGQKVPAAVTALAYLNKPTKEKIEKVLNSAIANARLKGFTEDQLVVSKAIADQGPVWKRFRAATMGRATEILKKTSHITIELDIKVNKG
ncbi:MAG: 50S ribosomal protein L22 [Candidatus Omnitrophica bacterium]|nr:50S ribosomal protein L22 [Candidatus Omnitrophota bacterium]